MTKHKQNHSNLAINARETLYYLSKTNKMVLKLEFAIIKGLKKSCNNGEI